MELHPDNTHLLFLSFLLCHLDLKKGLNLKEKCCIVFSCIYVPHLPSKETHLRNMSILT